MPRIDPQALGREVRSGDRRALARAITLIESARTDDRVTGNALLAQLAPHAGRSIRVGVSGVPGVGKSTLIEGLGNHVIDAGHRVAVLAVDPSSAVSGGSILGDKTRMETLSRRPEAFIRPSPSRGTLGGVTRHTRETMLLVEAAGFDVVLVETVGVGQSETAVSGMTDMFLLLLLPAAGDELQGIKRGIVELADLVVVNKADGELSAVASRAAADYRNALRLLQPRWEDWEVQVETCSALEGHGIDSIWAVVETFRNQREASGDLARVRARQSVTWLWSELSENLLELMRQDEALKQQIAALEKAVATGDASPRVAAFQLINEFWQRGKK